MDGGSLQGLDREGPDLRTRRRGQPAGPGRLALRGQGLPGRGPAPGLRHRDRPGRRRGDGVQEGDRPRPRTHRRLPEAGPDHRARRGQRVRDAHRGRREEHPLAEDQDARETGPRLHAGEGRQQLQGGELPHHGARQALRDLRPEGSPLRPPHLHVRAHEEGSRTSPTSTPSPARTFSIWTPASSPATTSPRSSGRSARSPTRSSGRTA